MTVCIKLLFGQALRYLPETTDAEETNSPKNEGKTSVYVTMIVDRFNRYRSVYIMGPTRVSKLRYQATAAAIPNHITYFHFFNRRVRSRNLWSFILSGKTRDVTGIWRR